MQSMAHDEWLESGGDGSFALGCVDRKYHGLLTVREPGQRAAS